MDELKLVKKLRQSGARLPPRVVERKIMREIIPWMRRDEIIVITGARQTGKSVLLYQLIYDYLIKKSKNIHYFNLDIPGHLDFLNHYDNIIDLISSSKAKSYLFIDEIQRIKEPGLFLKGIYDLHLPVKIVVSGSSALELKSKVHEALTGRKIIFHIDPFTFEELSQAIYPKMRFEDVLKEDRYFENILRHFLIYGSYPAVSMAKKKETKLKLLGEIFHSYLEKDVKGYLRVEKEDTFMNLIRILSSQIGQIMNKDELSNRLDIHKNTLENYLYYLEQTFVLDFVRPFFRNKRKELLKNPKVYFRDLGLRNYAIGNFGTGEFHSDYGALFENGVYLSLKTKIGPMNRIHFWKTKAKSEIDFVVPVGLTPIACEVKSTPLKTFKAGKSLVSFINSYKPPIVYYLNQSLRGKRTIDQTEIRYLTPKEFIQMKDYGV